jgi:hypothetical protein
VIITSGEPATTRGISSTHDGLSATELRATDAQDGALPASALSWELILQHCPSNCPHPLEYYAGVPSHGQDVCDSEEQVREHQTDAGDANGESDGLSGRQVAMPNAGVPRIWPTNPVIKKNRP